MSSSSRSRPLRRIPFAAFACALLLAGGALLPLAASERVEASMAEASLIASLHNEVAKRVMAGASWDAARAGNEQSVLDAEAAALAAAGRVSASDAASARGLASGRLAEFDPLLTGDVGTPAYAQALHALLDELRADSRLSSDLVDALGALAATPPKDAPTLDEQAQRVFDDPARWAQTGGADDLLVATLVARQAHASTLLWTEVGGGSGPTLNIGGILADILGATLGFLLGGLALAVILGVAFSLFWYLFHSSPPTSCPDISKHSYSSTFTFSANVSTPTKSFVETAEAETHTVAVGTDCTYLDANSGAWVPGDDPYLGIGGGFFPSNSCSPNPHHSEAPGAAYSATDSSGGTIVYEAGTDGPLSLGPSSNGPCGLGDGVIDDTDPMDCFAGQEGMSVGSTVIQPATLEPNVPGANPYGDCVSADGGVWVALDYGVDTSTGAPVTSTPTSGVIWG